MYAHYGCADAIKSTDSLILRPIVDHIRAMVILGELNLMHNFVVVKSLVSPVILGIIITESVDSLCRDGADTPIVHVHCKFFLTREYSCFKPFSACEFLFFFLILLLLLLTRFLSNDFTRNWLK